MAKYKHRKIMILVVFKHDSSTATAITKTIMEYRQYPTWNNGSR